MIIESISLNDVLRKVISGKKINDVKVQEKMEGFKMVLKLGDSHVLESGWKSGRRANGSYLFWYVALDGREIFNEIDGKICSLG